MAFRSVLVLLEVLVFIAVFSLSIGRIPPSVPRIQKEFAKELSNEQNRKSAVSNVSISQNIRVDECPSHISYSEEILNGISDVLWERLRYIIGSWHLTPNTGRVHYHRNLAFLQDEDPTRDAKFDTYTFLERNFYELASSGLLEITRKTVKSSTARNTDTIEYGVVNQRDLVTEVSFQRLFRDYSNGVCAERSSLPMKWQLSTRSGGKENRKPLEVNAIPVQLLENGTFRVVTEEGFPRWSLVKPVNQEFFKTNKFDHKVAVDTWNETRNHGEFVARQAQHYFEVPDEMYHCIFNCTRVCDEYKEVAN